MATEADREFMEKARSFHAPRRGARQPKVTVDEHGPARKVIVTEHWDDRVDVHAVNPEVTVNPNLVAREAQ